MHSIIWLCFLTVINSQEDEPVPQIFQIRSNIEIYAANWTMDEIEELVNTEIEDLFCESGRITFPGAEKCILENSGE